MSRKPVTPDALAAASARLSRLIKKGARSYMAELQRHAAEPEQDNRAAQDDGAVAEIRCDLSPGTSEGFADIIRLRGAMGVALALLDELLELIPPEPGSTYAQEVTELFQEMGQIAADGASAAKRLQPEERS